MLLNIVAITSWRRVHRHPTGTRVPVFAGKYKCPEDTNTVEGVPKAYLNGIGLSTSFHGARSADFADGNSAAAQASALGWEFFSFADIIGGAAQSNGQKAGAAGPRSFRDRAGRTRLLRRGGQDVERASSRPGLPVLRRRCDVLHRGPVSAAG